MEDKKPLLGLPESEVQGYDADSYSGQNNVQQYQAPDYERNGICSRPDVSSSRFHTPGGNRSHSNARRLIAFFISCVAKFVTGAVFVFFVYQDAIKQKFNYSQKEVEVLAAMMNIGLGLGFLPGMFFDRFGPRLTSAAGLIISTGSYLLVWSTTFTFDFYSDKSWLMSIFFLLTGFGPGFTLMVALNTNILNFHKRHTGKVVGTLNAFFAGSPSVFATIYYNWFTHGDVTKAKNQDFRGFMLMIAIMFCAINMLNLIFVYKIPVSDESVSVVENNDKEAARKTSVAVNQTNNSSVMTTEHSSLIDNVETENQAIYPHGDNIGDEHVPFWKLLLNVNYILFLIIFSLASTLSLVFGVNITTISKSVKLDNYNQYLTIISPITNAVFSICIGFFSDYFRHRIPRLQIIIAACVAFTLCYLLVVVVPTSIEAIMVAAFLCGIGIAFLYSMTPPLMKEMFNMRNFGRNWGVALLAQSAVSMPAQILFGAMYDAQVETVGGHDCYGSKCIVGGMAVFLGTAVITTLLGVLMLNLERLKSACRRA